TAKSSADRVSDSAGGRACTERRGMRLRFTAPPLLSSWATSRCGGGGQCPTPHGDSSVPRSERQRRAAVVEKLLLRDTDIGRPHARGHVAGAGGLIDAGQLPRRLDVVRGVVPRHLRNEVEAVRRQGAQRQVEATSAYLRTGQVGWAADRAPRALSVRSAN